MATPTEEPIFPSEPPAIERPAPSTIAPKLESITQDDLAKEIAGDAPPPKKERAIFKDGNDNLRVGGDKGVAEQDMDFGAKAREMMDRKQKEAAAPAADKVEKPKKEVVSVDDALPPKKEDKPVSDEVPEDERRVLPHDRPSTAKRINYFLRENAKLSKELEEAKKTATAAPTQENVEEVTKLREEYSKARDELIKYRRRFEVDADPEFKAKYDEPVAHAETAIENTLKKYQLGDATLKAIKDEGGFAAFSRSTKTFPIIELDEAGEKKTVMRTAGELARNWLNAIPVADSEFIKSALGKQQMLGSEKQQAVERAVGESKQFFEQRQAQQREQQEAQQKDLQNKSKEYSDWLKTTTESTEWLKDKPVPANASEDQRKQVEEHNEFNKQLRDKLTAHPKNTAEYTAIMLEAAEAHHLRREMGSKDERIKSLEAELWRVKGGMRTTPKAGSLLSDANKKPKEDTGAPDDFKGGFRKGFQRLQEGSDE